MPVEGLRRPAWAEISRSALAHNVGVVSRAVGPSAVCGVVKANGYGHGAVAAARAVADAGVAGLAVAIVDEGIELRDAGLDLPILLLAETGADSIEDALECRLTLTIGSVAGAREAARAAARLGGRHQVHVKVDTGMHRMGALPAELPAVLGALAEAPGIVVEGIYTHFAAADSAAPADVAYCAEQLARFEAARATARACGVDPPIAHAANSAAALGRDDARYSMCRVGLSLYGHLPYAELAGRDLGLVPALSLKAHVTAVRDLEAGERPSYGRRRALARDARVATVPFGYADGFPRRLFEAGAEVLIGGRRHPLAGTVTMDQLVIDCDGADVRVGDEVVLIGTQGDSRITAEDWARWSGTITWEVLCGIGARVPRVVVA